MDQLSQSFLGSCRQDAGRTLRGENMTRIETFVDAAFAFAFTMLVMLMLIFVYPIKLVIQLSVSYLSRGMLGTEPPEMLWSDMAQLFVYFGLGLVALSVIIICLYQNSLRHKEELVLRKYEVYYCKRMRLTWIVVALTAMVSSLVALAVNPTMVPAASYVYLSLFITIRLAEKHYERNNPLSQAQ